MPIVLRSQIQLNYLHAGGLIANRSPITRGDEGSPVVGMGIILAVQHIELGLMQGGTSALVCLEALIVMNHQVFGGLVGYFPEADDLAFSSSYDEGAAQSVDAFACGDVAESGVAGREDDEFGTGEVEVGDFQGRENAVIAAAFAESEACKDQTRQEERVTVRDSCS